MITSTRIGKKVYMAWADAKRRCYDEKLPSYFLYGGKGIALQDSWIDDVHSFYSYVSKLPNFSLSRSLDRIDNTKGYCEGNIRWATKVAQVRNRSKQTNNSSGNVGVSFHVNAKGVTVVRARWQTLEGWESKSKSFSVIKYGLLPAFKMACDYREKMIAELNAQGAGYSEKHGK